MNSMSKRVFLTLALVVAVLLAPMAGAKVVQDNFTGASATQDWTPFNGACLTAGDNTGSIPACHGLSYYGNETQTGLANNKDPVGQGALRLTNGCANGKCYYHQNGGIISTDPFPTDQGLQVTFTTYTYGGDNSGGHGADGIGFYLLNGDASPNLGAWGGSLGYSCSNANPPYNGMVDAYLGLGIDEYGNFLNQGDNTATGFGYKPGRIGLRGAGNISWDWLHANYPSYYPSGANHQSLVQKTCKTGQIPGSGNSASTTSTSTNAFPTSFSYYSTNSNNCGTGTYRQLNFSVGNTTGFQAGDQVQISATGTSSYMYATVCSVTGGSLHVRVNQGDVHQQSSPCYSGSSGLGPVFASFAPGSDGGRLVKVEGGWNWQGGGCKAPAAPSNWTIQDQVSHAVTLQDYTPINFTPCKNGNGPCSYVILPSSTPLANESAHKRTQATPITYKLKITPDGKLSFWYSYNGGTYTPVLTDQDITASNGPLPSSFKFGFGGSTGGSDNVHEITCFQAKPSNVSASSASENVQSGEVKTGTQVYLAFYHPQNWWGELKAQDLLVDPNTGAVSISPTANWDASCVLTGGACPATGATGMVAQGPGQRTLLTWNGSQGVPLQWADLSSSEQKALNAGDNNGDIRLAYLTGDRINEVNSGGTGLFRKRTSVLGDIMDSSPTYVGAPDAPYPATWQDDLYPGATMPENASSQNSVQTYPQFVSSEATRLNVVYDGANDGFLHGFESGYYDASGKYVSTSNDGKEVLAFMPEAVLKTIHDANDPQLDYSSPHYAHNFFADATPSVGDLFYNGAWHSWLVSGLGAGGNAVFGLDVTNPSQFSQASAAKLVRFELSPSTLACANDSGCGAELGDTYGTPRIRRLHDGKWAILFGNGLHSAGGQAGLFVQTVNSDGTLGAAYFIGTGVGSANAPDGITSVTPADMDGDHITDYVYAGDVDGNLWRFNLTSDNPQNWHVSTYGHGRGAPLFTTPQGAGQPITTQVQVLSVPSTTGGARVMVEFGTGAVTPQTPSSPKGYATGQQALFGIWDWDMNDWNSMSSRQYASLSSTSSVAPSSISLSQLQAQTVLKTGGATGTGAAQGYRTVSNSVICFTGTSCTSGSGASARTVAGSQFGWYLDLPGYAGVSGVASGNQTEQVLYNPVVTHGVFVVNTTVPSNNSPFSCTVRSAKGWTMALDPASGGALPQSFFANVNQEFPDATPGAILTGVALNATGTPTVVTADKKFYMINQTVNGIGNATLITPPGSGPGGRITWRELR